MYAFALDAIEVKIFPILHAWITVFTGLIAFGAAGLAATTFLPDRRVSMMAAPLAGIALCPFASLALYVSCNSTFALGFDSAARIALTVLLISGLLLLPRDRDSFGVAWRFLAVVAVASLVAPIVMAASVYRGEPALLYLDGADHTVYATLADWYRSHPPQSMPVGSGTVWPAIADPTQPYSSWVALVFEVGTRGGAYAYQALVSMLSGQPGMFSYDAATTIALIAACLGCAAVFSRSWIFFLCLAGALVTSLWYDYGHMGFLGKLLSYPLVIFTFGAFVSFRRSGAGPAEVLALAMIAAGAGLMHSAVGYALLFTSLAAALLLAEAVFQRRPPEVAAWALAAIAPAVALIASGTLARPLSDSIFPDYGVGWTNIAYLVTDLNSLFPNVSLLPRLALTASFLILCLCMGHVAVSRPTKPQCHGNRLAVWTHCAHSRILCVPSAGAGCSTCRLSLSGNSLCRLLARPTGQAKWTRDIQPELPSCDQHSFCFGFFAHPSRNRFRSSLYPRRRPEADVCRQRLRPPASCDR